MQLVQCFVIQEASSSMQQQNKNRKPTSGFPVFGPSVEIRTRGLLNPIQARYQTSPHPEIARVSRPLGYTITPPQKKQAFFYFLRKIFIRRLHL